CGVRRATAEGSPEALRVRILLDTHAFVWWVTDSEELSRRARRLIADGANEVFFSVASAWEIAVKSRLRRAVLPEDAEHFVSEQLRCDRPPSSERLDTPWGRGYALTCPRLRARRGESQMSAEENKALIRRVTDEEIGRAS